jgi:hypothetical protein
MLSRWSSSTSFVKRLFQMKSLSSPMALEGEVREEAPPDTIAEDID